MKLLCVCIHLIFIILNLKNLNCTMTQHFRNYIIKEFGLSVEQEMSREDVGEGGSFGGGSSHVPGQKTEKRPVIIVHGITNTASTFARTKNFFLEHGYKDEEVYGTTYGDGGKMFYFLVNMKCHYVKVIRMLILIVSKYTNSKVDVIAYSLGSPIARKAIKGGRCVDTSEELGPPLSDLVETFIGVAGANYGSKHCYVSYLVCNNENGLGCSSQFLEDINNRPRFEGTNIYTIYSTADEKVGHMACNKVASSIRDQNHSYVLDGLNHDDVMHNTLQLQYNLITLNHG